jgi:uncharacterized protein HemX
MAVRAEIVGATWPFRREDPQMPARRWTDASKLSFPLQLVITIVGVALAAAVGVWSTQSQLERSQSELSARIEKTQLQLASDVRNILTQMEADKRVADANAKLSESNLGQMKTAIDAMTRRTELQQMQIAELQKSIALLTQGRR